MLQNLTNFFNLIRTRKIKTTLADNDLIAVGTRDNTWGGNYQPTAITYANLLSEIETQVLNIAALKFTYEIGQYIPEQGGVVFHRWLSTTPFGTPTSGTVENYLVVDTTDVSTGAQWATLNFNIGIADSTWNGPLNTQTCFSAETSPVTGIVPGVASWLCYTSTNNGKDDWYLPAVDELSKLWHNRWEVARGLIAAGGTQIAINDYWSSTQEDADYVFTFTFIGGSAGSGGNKQTSLHVRAVRAFSI
jgi:hypothetical protein